MTRQWRRWNWSYPILFFLVYCCIQFRGI